ncbi:AraC family transcriptional regulator [Actinomadura sp. ATCC 31491]|uniref:AraC family transcriptional regulator n=1 Tax=Actinomadura luzonensis TaxID=2805427 RepID=A0ABT0G5W7_9ACTN|nr:AraC family transcriptional regulator [Actinomadura luzonensis]MCK2219984.1 AraC family transcriptional regulator [Actinomadura luzonensis]
MDVLSDALAAMRTGRPHASRTVVRAPWGVRFRPQQGAGFHVVLRGECHLLPARGEPVALRAGDVVFLPRELGHGLADTPATPPAESLTQGGGGPVTELLCGAYRLDQSRLHPLLTELPDVMLIPAGDDHPALRGAIALLAGELGGSPGPGADAAAGALLDVLLLYLLRAWYESRPAGEDTGWAAALRDPRIMEALRAVHARPARPWTVQSLAAVAGLSRAAFAQRFTATVGAPPLAYLTWWRMTTAARLLRESDLPLRSVAERSGYASEFAFAKAFKREFGTAPGRYRSGLEAAG